MNTPQITATQFQLDTFNEVGKLIFDLPKKRSKYCKELQEKYTEIKALYPEYDSAPTLIQQALADLDLAYQMAVYSDCPITLDDVDSVGHESFYVTIAN